MTTFNFTTGNPANLTSGANASMADIQGPLNDLRTFLNGGNLDATNLAAAQAWQTIPLAFSANLSYYKDQLGRVHFRGDSLGPAPGSILANATLATMPVGYRPLVTEYFPLVRVDVATVMFVSVTSAGVISTPQALASGGSFSFGAVRYRAE